MKLQLEEIDPTGSSSFRILVNPNLSNLFFWHFHPELELVFISGTNGTRHVGEHISAFEQWDLVLIGSNIPHLNFDYGVKGPYEKIVLHLRPDFLQSAFGDTPELTRIEKLFEWANHGVSFGNHSMEQVGERLKKLHLLGEFERFVEVLNILNILAVASDRKLLHDSPVQNNFGAKEKKRLDTIYRFIGANYQRKIDIQEVADISNLTKEAFCRYFKKMSKLTFTQFVNHYRIDIAKKLLLKGETIADVCYGCGFESLSYFNRVFKRVTGTSPTGFRNEYSTSTGPVS